MTVLDPAVAPRLQRWAVANTHVNQEHIALEQLARQNYHAYCPIIVRQRRHARRVETVRRPLFPGYLFIRLDLGRDRWRPILSTVGVRTLVHFGEQLGLLDDAFIQNLRKREWDGVIVQPASPYRPGQQVRLNGGPFDGIVATILAVSDKDRLVILMDLLQRRVRATVTADQVMPG